VFVDLYGCCDWRGRVTSRAIGYALPGLDCSGSMQGHW
jgi:hypothetical protein